MAVLALTIRAVTLTTTRLTSRLTSVVTVSVFGTALVMTRSAYHPFWLIGVLALVCGLNVTSCAGALSNRYSIKQT